MRAKLLPTAITPKAFGSFAYAGIIRIRSMRVCSQPAHFSGKHPFLESALLSKAQNYKFPRNRKHTAQSLCFLSLQIGIFEKSIICECAK